MLTLPATELQQRNAYLTTTGRVTGKAHEIEIWFAADPDDGTTIFMLSGGRDRSDWVRNVRASPHVSLRLGATTYRGAVRIIAPDEPLDLHAREIVAAKYQGWRAGQPFSQWAHESLAVVIELQGVLT